MLKKFLAIGTLLALAACTTVSDEGKTPRTEVGRLNGCMLDGAYDLKAAGKLAGQNKWTVARNILSSCERKLNLSPDEINETQSLNIIVSVIDTLK